MQLNGISIHKYVDISFFNGTDGVYVKETGFYVDSASHNALAIQDELFSHFGVKTKSSEVEPDKLGKMFFGELASVPRYKIRDIKEKHNVSIVRDSTKADTIVISKDEVTKNMYHKWGVYLLVRKEMEEFLTACLADDVKSSNANFAYKSGHYSIKSYIEIVDDKKAIQQALDCIKDLPEDIQTIGLNYGHKETVVKLSEGFFKKSLTLLYHNPNIIEEALLSNLTHYIDKNIITDSALQTILGSCEMTHDNYIFVDELLKSSDPGNIELGLTMMANCNFEESQHYLLMLLGDHYSKHRYVKYTQSVAFKSLLNFMDFSYRTHVTLDDILFKADSVGKLTDEIKGIVHDRAFNEIQAFNRYKWVNLKGIEIIKPENDTKKGRD